MCFQPCTSVCLTGVLVSGRIGAVKVHILMSHEATVLVLCLDVCPRDGVPRIAHALLDVGLGERWTNKHALAPEVEESCQAG